MTDLQFYTEWGTLLETWGPYALGSEFGVGRWEVCWNGEVDNGAPFVSIGGTPKALERWGRGYRVPTESLTPAKGKGDEISYTGGYAGEVRLYRDEKLSDLLTPRLRLESATMSKAHYKQILESLKELARMSSVTEALIRASDVVSDIGERKHSPFSQLTRWAKAALDCLNQYEAQLVAIGEGSAKTMRTRTQLADSDRAARLGLLQHVLRWPQSRRHVPIPIREYSTDTPERSFLQATLYEVCQISESIINSLGYRLGLQVESCEDVSGDRRASGYWLPNNLDEAKTVLDSLQKAKIKLMGFLGDDKPTEDGVDALTNRLQMSLDYSPFLTAWENFKRIVPVSTMRSRANSRIDERSIGRSSLLYERWVAYRIYLGLRELQFAPPKGCRELTDAIEVRDRGLDFEGSFKLVKRCHGVEINLVFDVQQKLPKDGVNPLTPDLAIHVRTSNGQKQTWILDAKYKQYSKGAPSYGEKDKKKYGSHILADLVGVADLKYRRKLSEKLSEQDSPITVSAILFPDSPDSEYGFWDQGPAEAIKNPIFKAWDEEMGTVLEEDPDLVKDWRHGKTKAMKPHAILAVPLLPLVAEIPLQRLFWILFGFHLGIANTCWVCGEDCEVLEKKETDGEQANKIKSKGDSYRCNHCNSFWVDSWCSNPKCHKRLIKVVPPIHRPKDESNPRYVICPYCGDCGDGTQVQVE